MNKFKALFSVLTAAIIAATLTACQNGGELSNDVPLSGTESSNTTISEMSSSSVLSSESLTSGSSISLAGSSSSSSSILSSNSSSSISSSGSSSSSPSSNHFSSSSPIQSSSSPSSTPSSSSSVSVPSSSSNIITAPATPAEKSEKILIAYFSRVGNTNYSDDVDASTSASIVINNGRFGTTEYVARMIQEIVGGDIHLIETVTPYTADFDELRDVNHSEMASNYLPELKESNLNISQYDTVFIGYPVWATDVPQAVISFLNMYDFSDKRVIPFCTHDGYGAGRSYSTIAAASKAKNTADGLAIEAKNVPKAKNTVSSWLDSIGISKGSSNTAETAIKIKIGDIILDGVLYDTALAREIKQQLPLTISMSGYGGREYYGGVDFYPKNVQGGKKTFENGDITYCEAHHNMAIFYAQTNNPNLSVDVIPIGKVTSDLTVFDTLGSRETVTFSLA